jgi:imidazolonepropionase-like amidohydrolase
MRAIDGIRPEDGRLMNGIIGGVTTICTGPGSANVVCGTFVAMKLAGNCVDDMVIKNNVAMKCAFGENPKGVYGSSKKAPVTRMATAALLRELLFKTRNYMEAKDAGKNPAFDMKMEALIPVLKKEVSLKAHVHRADDIFTAIRIAREFDLKLTLDHCGDGHLIAEEMAEAGYPAILGPYLYGKPKIETKNRSFATPGILHKAGVLISITTDAPVVPIQYLPLSAGMAVAEGLPYETAWEAITINPARIMGIADRVGSLEVGKDADIVIWTDDPLTAVSGRAYTTVVDGKVVWQMD